MWLMNEVARSETGEGGVVSGDAPDWVVNVWLVEIEVFPDESADFTLKL